MHAFITAVGWIPCAPISLTHRPVYISWIVILVINTSLNHWTRSLVAYEKLHSWISINDRLDKNAHLFLSQQFTVISWVFTTSHGGLCLIHFRPNTICQWVHTYTVHWGLQAHGQTQWVCVDFFFLQTRLKVRVLCDSAWPRDSCCTLCSNWRPCCLSFLSHYL